MVSPARAASLAAAARRVRHACYRGARVAWRVGAVLLGVVVVVLALLGLPHVFRAAPLQVVVARGDPAGPPAVADQRFIRMVGALTGTPLELGNRVEILSNGDETFPRLYQDLRSARRSITMQMYYKSGGVVADSVRRILAERARSGVHVYFMHDAFGSEALPAPYNDTLRAAGVRVAAFRPFRWYELDRLGHRSHTRAIIIDGAIGYTGGFGLDDKWLGGGRRRDEWRETNVRFAGPSARQLQAAFTEEWAEATGELLTGDPLFPPVAVATDGAHLAGVLHSIPTSGSSPAERLLALSIAGSRRTLYIANAYFLPNAGFRRLLTDATRRGVDVRILTNGENTDIRATRLASRAHYEELLRAGVRIFEYQPAMMHAKTFVVDGLWSSVGTMNFDNRSLALNNESTLVVHDQALGAAMDSLFLEDLRFAREITLEAFRRRPWTERLLERGASLLSRAL